MGKMVSANGRLKKNVVHKTNSLYWDTKGNDFLKAIVLPYYGAFISEEKCQLFGDISGKNCWRSATEMVNPCNIKGNETHLNYGLWIFQKDKLKSVRNI